MVIVGSVIEFALWMFIGLLLVRLVIDWVLLFARSWEPKGVVLVALEGAYTATDPPIKVLRRAIPPLNLGGVRLDMSFIVVLIIAYILLIVNRTVLLY